MQGKLVAHIACINPECGSSDALAVYEKEDDDGKRYEDGYCWSCKSWFKEPRGEASGDIQAPKQNPKGRGQVAQQRVNDIEALPYRALTDRGIRADVAEYFGVRSTVSPRDGETVLEHFYPRTENGQVLGYKIRNVADKSFGCIGNCKTKEAFGEQQARDSGGKKLIITEGECDAMALFQMLKDQAKGTQYANLNPGVISVPNGASAASKWLGERADLTSRYTEIVLVFDQDEPGEKAAKECAAVLPPGKARIATYSEKDPNEMLRKGKGYAMKSEVIFNAKEYRPDSLKKVADLREEILKPVTWGESWPWQSVTQSTFGRSPGELHIFGAGSGCGKTEVFKEMIHHDMCDLGNKVGVFFLEEPPGRTIKAIAGKMFNKRFHIPNAGWKQSELEEAYDALVKQDLLQIYADDSAGVRKWEAIKERIRYLVLVMEVKHIYLDHLTALTADASDERRALDTMLAEMSAMAEDWEFTFYAISHLTRPGQGRKSHEEGGRVRMADFRGSGAIGFWAHYMWGIERNTQADGDDKHLVKFRCIKDRMSGNATGQVVPMRYNPELGRLEETLHVIDDNDNEDPY